MNEHPYPFAAWLLILSGIVVGTALAGGQASPAPAPQADKRESLAGAPDTTKCLVCHRAEQVPDLPKEAVPFGESVHGEFECTDCHTGIDRLTVPESLPAKKPPHPVHVPPVDCGTCHDDEAALYTMHGPGIVGKNPDIPTCAHCHGGHDILPASDARSHVNPDRLPDTCRRCHARVNLAKKYYQLSAAFVRAYHVSVHGEPATPGATVAATCEDCHDAASSDGTRTAHLILGPSSPKSSIYYFNIPNTCGRCHTTIVKDYWEGIHGQLVARGEVGAPVCTRCHGEHGIFRVTDPRSPVSPTEVAVETCSPCHDSVVLSERYGLPGGRLNTYAGSYHGLKARAGDTLVANCASCHGAHRILPSSDPNSSISPANLRRTCGQCHPGISQQVASTPIHQTETTLKSGWAHFFTVFYIVLIVVTIGLMILHDFGDWLSSVRDQASRPFVLRLSTNEVVQHWVLMLSFVVLVVTGFALRFDDSWWARLMFGWDRGFTVRGIIHRAAGTILIVTSIWHLGYLFGARGRHWLRDMLASRKDFADVKHNALHFLGLRKHRARFGRFSYVEKVEYWAMVWGAVIMSVTGLLLWFDNEVAVVLPKGFLQVALVIHYYEAWLATLAILVWHIYGTVLRPAVAPMNPSWWSGTMPKQMYDEEHPEAPDLPARIRTCPPQPSAGKTDQHPASNGTVPAAPPVEPGTTAVTCRPDDASSAPS